MKEEILDNQSAVLVPLHKNVFVRSSHEIVNLIRVTCRYIPKYYLRNSDVENKWLE